MSEFSREELIARLRALSEIQQPARLGVEEDRAWRVVCREAATALEYVHGPVAWRYKVHVTQQDWFYSWDEPLHDIKEPLFTRPRDSSLPVPPKDGV